VGSRQEPGRAPRPRPGRVPGRHLPAEPSPTRPSWLRRKTKSLRIRVRFAPGKHLCVAELAAARVPLPSRGSPGWAAPEGRPRDSLPLPAPGMAKPPPRQGLPHGCEVARPPAPRGFRLRDGSRGSGAVGREPRAGWSRAPGWVLSAGGTAGCRT